MEGSGRGEGRERELLGGRGRGVRRCLFALLADGEIPPKRRSLGSIVYFLYGPGWLGGFCIVEDFFLIFFVLFAHARWSGRWPVAADGIGGETAMGGLQASTRVTYSTPVPYIQV